MRSIHTSRIGALAFCLVFAAGRPVAAADLWVASETLSLPGDAATGLPKKAFQDGYELVLDPDVSEQRMDATFSNTLEIRIETITAMVHAPTGQMPWLYLETRDADGTTTRHDVALQSMGSYLTPGKKLYTRWSATHYVRLFSKSGDVFPPVSEITWSFGRTAPGVPEYATANFSLSGYRVAGNDVDDTSGK
jgi:hypothetical protein